MEFRKNTVLLWVAIHLGLLAFAASVFASLGTESKTSSLLSPVSPAEKNGLTQKEDLAKKNPSVKAASSNVDNSSQKDPSPKKVDTVQTSVQTTVLPDELLRNWCRDLKKATDELKWKIDPCDGIQWKIGGTSVQGRPLVYAEFGDLKADNTTLIFSMVHGDEITPLYLGLQLAHLLKETKNQVLKTRVVIAPLVNPDGFFKTPRTRVNANGVDINRNFATADWSDKATALWKSKFKSDPRRYPGKKASSEPETLFQEVLIELVSPRKLVSFHSPLNFLDYDGPGTITLPNFPTDYIRECIKLRKTLKAVSGGFFPGSLGNYAGHRGIPTITAELRSSDSNKADQYWKQVKPWIETLIQFSVPSYALGSAQPKPGS